MILPIPPEYAEFLTPYPKATQELAVALREKLVQLLPDCIETLWDATNTVGMAYGFTEKNADHFLHLPVYTKYVNIGFSQGAALQDPEMRLKGSGARIRHIRLTRPEELDDPYLYDLIRQAHETALRPVHPIEPRTIIRVMEGPKRRPKA
jgi:hypothetical protein